MSATNQLVDPVTGEVRVAFKRDLHTTDSNGQPIIDGQAKVRRAEEINAKRMELARLLQEEAAAVAGDAPAAAPDAAYSELKAQMAKLQKELAESKSLPKESPVAPPAPKQVNESSESAKMSVDDTEYTKYAAFAKRLEEEKAAAAKVAQAAADEEAKRKAEIDAIVKAQVAEALKQAGAAAPAPQVAGKKRSAAETEQAEDDDFVESLNATGAPDADTDEINSKFKEFNDKYEKLKKDKENFERGKYRLSREKQEAGEKTLAERGAEVKSLQSGLLDYVAAKFAAYKKVKDASISSDYAETIADIKSESEVDMRGLKLLKSQAVLAAASASRANQAARSLQDLEDKMKAARRELELSKAQQAGLQSDNAAAAAAKRLDPANHQSTSALSSSNPAPMATGTKVFDMPIASQESIAEAEQNFGKPAFLAYATSANFQAVASNRPAIAKDAKKDSDLAWVRKLDVMDNVPQSFEHDGRIYSASFSHDADGPKRAMFYTPPTPVNGLMHSENPTQRKIGATLIAIRDAMGGNKGRLPQVTPLQYWGSAEEAAKNNQLPMPAMY